MKPNTDIHLNKMNSFTSQTFLFDFIAVKVIKLELVRGGNSLQLSIS